LGALCFEFSFCGGELHGGVGEFLGCGQLSFLVLNRLEVSPLIDQQHGSESPEGEPEEGAGEGEDLSWSSQQRFRVGFLTDNQDGPDDVGRDVEERCDCDDAGRQLEPCAFFSEQLAGAPSQEENQRCGVEQRAKP
jgi:hypothetical protein